MKKEYDTFVDSLASLREGQEIRLNVRDLTPGRAKYAPKLVRAVLSSQSLPQADTLWIRFDRGQLHPGPWSIQVLEVLGDYEPIPVEEAGLLS